MQPRSAAALRTWFDFSPRFPRACAHQDGGIGMKREVELLYLLAQQLNGVQYFQIETRNYSAYFSTL
jgi:hypothetical protein